MMNFLHIYSTTSSDGLVVLGILVVVSILGIFMVSTLRHQSDMRRCEAIIQKNSLTFYKAFSKLPNRKQREAVYAVYAFCRYADDLADEYRDVEGLNRLEDELIRFEKGLTPDSFMWRALRHTLKPFYKKDADYTPFHRMIEGQRSDLQFQPYQTLDELLDYCYDVAGTVGLMLIPILSPKHHVHLKDFAVKLGYAMQITNILRDVGEDLQRGRIYLPMSLMAEYGVSADDLRSGRVTRGFVQLFEMLAVIAETHFQSALDQMDLFPQSTRLPLGLSIVLYRAILDSARQAKYDVFHQRIYVSDDVKEQLISMYKNTLLGDKK